MEALSIELSRLMALGGSRPQEGLRAFVAADPTLSPLGFTHAPTARPASPVAVGEGGRDPYLIDVARLTSRPPVATLTGTFGWMGRRGGRGTGTPCRRCGGASSRPHVRGSAESYQCDGQRR